MIPAADVKPGGDDPRGDDPAGDGPVRSIAVIGGGVAAWAAAAAFVRRLPGVAVTVVGAGAPPQLADLIATAAPSAVDFHADLGIAEADVLASGGVFRLGSRLVGWSARPFLHCFGEHGATLAGAAFHHHWHRVGAPAGGFGDYSLAGSLAGAGRFLPVAPAGLPQFGYGYSLDAAAYTALLRQAAGDRRHARLRGDVAPPSTTGATVAAAIAETDGRVTGLVLSNGDRLAADLYVDTIGIVADRVRSGWTDWSRWLPAAHLAVARGAADPALPLVDTVTRNAGGWTLTAPLRDGTLVARATAAPAEDTESHRFSPGMRTAPWVGNVVAIGDAAVVLDPLDGVALHLVHAHVDRIVALLPGREFSAVELDDYNRQTRDEAVRLRDFAVLRHVDARSREPNGHSAVTADLPESLARDVRLWCSRGYLPIHDGESFTAGSWHSLLVGHGLVPQRVDPLAAELPLAHAIGQLAAMRAAITAAVRAAPSHAAALAALEQAR